MGGDAFLSTVSDAGRSWVEWDLFVFADGPAKTADSRSVCGEERDNADIL